MWGDGSSQTARLQVHERPTLPEAGAAAGPAGVAAPAVRADRGGLLLERGYRRVDLGPPGRGARRDGRLKGVVAQRNGGFEPSDLSNQCVLPTHTPA